MTASILAVTSSAFPAGYSLQFGGVDDYVSVEPTAAFPPTGNSSVTIEMWLQMTKASAGGSILLGWGSEGYYQVHFTLINAANDFGFTHWGLDNYYDVNLVPGVWRHLAAVHDGAAGRDVVYLDGIAVGTNATPPLAVTRTGIVMGKHPNVGGYYFEGLMDEVRIWSVARTGEEIRSTMKTALTGSPAGLAARWGFEEGVGNTAADSTGNGHAATLFNGTAWSTNTAVEPAVIWGIKTHDPTSQAPTTLFRFGEGGAGYAEIGRVKVAGADIEADGLALSPTGALLAFQMNVGGGSRLISINQTSAVATVIGPVLANRDLRGAAFLLSGKLIAFDRTATELVAIDPATGASFGQPVPVKGLLAGAGSSGDLTTTPGGALVFAQAAEVYSLNPRTGVATLVFQDTNSLPDGYLPYCCGVACSPLAAPENTIFGYEASIDDDVHQYLPASGFARTLLLRNVVPSYNAGRGDLAALPASRVELLEFRISGGGATLATVCRAGLWAWVEFTDDLTSSNWQGVPDTKTLIPYSNGSIATAQTWTNLPASAQNRFFRVATQ